MIIGWIRLAFFAAIGLALVWFLALLYIRSLRREKLEKQWLSEALSGDRAAFIARGMQAGEKGLKRRLLWLIFILPLVAFTLIFFCVNWF